MPERTHESMSNFFDNWSEGYEDRFATPALRSHLVDRRMGPLISLASPSDLFVDIGCGTGASMRLMPSRAVGIDLAPGMLRQARQHFNVAAASGTELPFGADVADIISTQLVLHHVNFYLGIDGVSKVISEMVRVTKPGGTVAILEANPLNPYWRIFMKRHGEDNALLIRPWVLRRILAESSNSEPEILFRGFLPEFLPAWSVSTAIKVEQMFEWLPTKLFAGNYMLIARNNK
jgi:ubiquinone/menaquinone biosynthesis C-methylase UbiE